MKAEQSPAPGRREELPKFKLMRGIPVADRHGRKRLVRVPMSEYVGADALRTVRALCEPGVPERDADGSSAVGKQPIP